MKQDPEYEDAHLYLLWAKMHKANEKGIEYLAKGDWDNAIKCYTEALEHAPDDQPVIKNNLENARKQKELQIELEAKRLREQKRQEDIAKNNQMLEDLGYQLIKPGDINPELRQKEDEFAEKATETKDRLIMGPTKQSFFATEEETRRDPNWLPKERELILKTGRDEKKRIKDFMASVMAGRYPDPRYRPKTLDDLKSGDILIMAPEDYGNIIAVLDQLYTGRAFETGRLKAKGSHTTMFMKNSAGGEKMFSDHRAVKGSHFINKEEFFREYSRRKIFVARPLLTPDGEEIFKWAKERAAKTRDGRIGSSFGLIGKDKLCSEEMVEGIIKTTILPLERFKHKGAVELTVGDLFDERHIGLYFWVTPLYLEEYEEPPEGFEKP